MTIIFEYMGEIVEAQFEYLKQLIIELEAQIINPLITISKFLAQGNDFPAF